MEQKVTGSCLLVTGGNVEAAFAASVFKEGKWDVVVAADSGLLACRAAGLFPQHIVGDFDSLESRLADIEKAGSVDGKGGVEDEAGGGVGSGEAAEEAGRSDRCLQLLAWYVNRGSELHSFSPRKDLTDTQIGVELAIRLGYGKICVLGGTGTRLDHMLGNLQTMELALDLGAELVLLDPFNRVSMHRTPFRVMRELQWGSFISFIPWGGAVENLALTGFRYPLSGRTMASAGTLGISNELEEDTGEVSFDSGTLLMVEAADHGRKPRI